MNCSPPLNLLTKWNKATFHYGLSVSLTVHMYRNTDPIPLSRNHAQEL